MNRRVTKRKSVSFVDQVKNKLSGVDWRAPLAQAKIQLDRLPKLHQRVIGALSIMIVVLLVWPAPTATTEKIDIQSTSSSDERKAVTLNTKGLSEQHSSTASAPKSDTWQEYTVKAGDTLAQVFRANDLPMADLNALAKIEGSDKPLSRIKQGQLVRFKRDEQGQLDILQLEKKQGAVMFFRLSDGGFGRSK